MYKNGLLVGQTENAFNAAKAVFRFNADNGDLWSAVSKDLSFSADPFKIVRAFLNVPDDFLPGNDMVAIWDGAHDDWRNGSTFRMSASDKKTGLVFFYLESGVSYPMIYTGKCTVYKDRLPPLARD